jgi:hypothetical protein
MQYDVVLGRGAFKTVYKAFDEAEGIEVAWNQVKVNDMVRPRNRAIHDIEAELHDCSHRQKQTAGVPGRWSARVPPWRGT